MLLAHEPLVTATVGRRGSTQGYRSACCSKPLSLALATMGCRVLAIWLITWAICRSNDDAVLHAQSHPRISGSQSSAADRLHVGSLFFDEEIGQAISREEARVQRTCANADDVARCTDRETRPFALHFGRVRDAPSFTAPIAG